MKDSVTFPTHRDESMKSLAAVLAAQINTSQDAIISMSRLLTHYLAFDGTPARLLASIVATTLAHNPDLVAEFDECMIDLRKGNF